MHNPISWLEIEKQIKGEPITYIQAQCSTGHTFGNITAYVQNWLINLFPKDTFKTVHVNSKIAHAQIRSTPKEFLKKDPPMFIIRPRIEWNDTGKFLKGTSIAERQGDLYSTYGMTNLMDFFQDDRNKVAIKYQLNRHVITFDVVLIFQTMLQQINWSNYILNATRYEIPFNLETCLESYISPELLKVLSEVSGVPMKDDTGSNRKFLSYLNSNSIYPITHKLQGSTGTEEYYRYYPVNIDTIITGFNVDEGNKIGQITNRYQISFSLRCEFFGTGFYYLFTDKIQEHAVITCDNDSTTIIPLFTDILVRDDLNLPPHWRIFAQPVLKLEHSNDFISIDSLFNTSIKECFKYHLERNIPISNFFHMTVRRQGQTMIEGKEYTFNPHTKEITFIDCETYYTYKIIISVNFEYINELIKDVYKFE